MQQETYSERIRDLHKRKQLINDWVRLELKSFCLTGLEFSIEIEFAPLSIVWKYYCSLTEDYWRLGRPKVVLISPVMSSPASSYLTVVSNFEQVTPQSLNKKRTVVWKLHWLTQPLSGAAFLFSSLPLLSFRFQPVSVSFAQGTGGLPRFHEMTVHDVYGDLSHAVQCIFLLHQRSTGTWVLYTEVKDLSDKSWAQSQHLLLPGCFLICVPNRCPGFK